MTEIFKLTARWHTGRIVEIMLTGDRPFTLDAIAAAIECVLRPDRSWREVAHELVRMARHGCFLVLDATDDRVVVQDATIGFEIEAQFQVGIGSSIPWLGSSGPILLRRDNSGQVKPVAAAEYEGRRQAHDPRATPGRN